MLTGIRTPYPKCGHFNIFYVKSSWELVSHIFVYLVMFYYMQYFKKYICWVARIRVPDLQAVA